MATGKSNVFGMGYPVVALVDTYTDGTSITYDAGLVLGTAVEAVYNAESSMNEDYGDDEVQDIDSGTNGISGTLELNMISLEKLSYLLGWAETAAGTGTPKVYHVTDEASPYVGFGYYKKDVASGGYVARWIYRAQFSRTSDTSRTKTQSVEWNHPTLDWRGTIVHLSTPAGKGVWNDEAAFETREDAKAWLNTKAGISAQSSSTQGGNTHGSGATGNP